MLLSKNGYDILIISSIMIIIFLLSLFFIDLISSIVFKSNGVNSPFSNFLIYSDKYNLIYSWIVSSLSSEF